MSDEPRRVYLPLLDERDLEKQLDRSALHSYGMHSAAFDRLHELSTFLFATMELLLAKGVITNEELGAYVLAVKEQQATKHWTKERGFAMNGDPRDKRTAQGAVVDCDARMHLCKGVCCSMEHPLQASDIQEGIVKWDHGRPYWIRHDADHRCSHQAKDGGQCGIFEARPLTCRLYTCEKDARVWKDFAARIPNQEGIEALFNKPNVRTMMEGSKTVNVAIDTEIKVKPET